MLEPPTRKRRLGITSGIHHDSNSTAAPQNVRASTSSSYYVVVLPKNNTMPRNMYVLRGSKSKPRAKLNLKQQATRAGAKQPIFGTNPICMSVPAAGGPVTMDMATAAYAWFGVLEAKTAGRPLPEGVAMDPQGRDTTDPEAVLSGGALKVFDGSHKGSALALFVELLAGPLVGAAVADKLEEKNWGNLIVAIDPSMLQVPPPPCLL